MSRQPEDRTPDQVLDDVNELRVKTRAARPRLSVPLFMVAVLISGAMPLYVQRPVFSGESSTSNPLGISGLLDLVSPTAATIYWLIAVPLCVVAVSYYCNRAGGRSGVRFRVQPWLWSGIVLFVLAVFATRNGLFGFAGNLMIRGLIPLLTVSVAVLVWGLVLRSVLLSAIGAVAVATSLVSNLYNVENLVPQQYAIDDRYSLLLNIAVTASVFLVGALVAVVVERVHR
ncbi:MULTISPECIES: hypothetical protein [unclassified Rhodococcus (in: high G+C Gram-positive bacteria)]|uniref:hypothetical protein n=1 Tax=unclassified Rhodococcus (in: high G+C Gram-positive bacteria) TaxID=192944 RepID=UPI003390FE42